MNITGRIRVVVVAFAAAMSSLVAYSSQKREFRVWSDMPTVLQQEILCRLLEVTNVQDLAVMEMREVCREIETGPTDGMAACKVELSLLGFSPASRLTQPCNSELDVSNIVFIARQRISLEEMYDAKLLNRGREWFYWPMLPRPGVTVIGCFHAMHHGEVDSHLAAERKRSTLVTNSMYMELKGYVDQRHSHTARCERVSFVRHDPLCIFEIRDNVVERNRENLSPISISRRDASEMFYVLLGEEGYKSRVKPGWFAPAESLRTLETEIGKSLAHLKSNHEELEKLRTKLRELSKIHWNMR